MRSSPSEPVARRLSAIAGFYRYAAGAGQSSRDLARPCSPCSPTTACAIGEALAADATDLGTEQGHRVLHITRKGGRRATVVLAPVTARALDDYLTGRDTGRLFITGGGRRYDEPAAFRLVRRLARAAGLDCAERLSPTACAMRSSPWPSTPACPCATYRTPPGTPTPRTTRRYDRARHNLDRAATYAVAAYLAGDGP